MSLTPRLDNLANIQNLIINGNMDFWQRGTSFAITGFNDFFCADRFRLGTNNAGTVNYIASRSTDVPTVAQSGFKSNYSYLVTNNAANTASYTITYPIEGADYATIFNKTVAISFWVKSSVAGNYSVGLELGDNSYSYMIPYSISLANTWEKKTVFVTLNQNATTPDFNSGRGIMLNFGVYSGGYYTPTSTYNQWIAGTLRVAASNTNWGVSNGATFQLSQVMLFDATYLPSNADVPFKRVGKTIGDELRLCQRYCWVDGAQDTADGFAHSFVESGQAVSGTILTGKVKFPVPMRVSPTLTLTATASSYQAINSTNSANPPLSALVLGSASPEQAYIEGTVGTGLTAGNASYITRVNGNTTSKLIWSAEF